MDDTDDGYFAGKILLATPGMGDPRFEKAVILLCAHDEKGAMGLVINHTLPGLDFKALLEQLKIKSEIKVDLKKLRFPVFTGGPVEGSRGFLLHSNDFCEKDTIRIHDQLSVTGTIEALQKIADGAGPEDILFILGYAGWGAGQLEEEIKQNAWMVCDSDPDIIFHGIPDEKWDMATKKMGIDPAMLSGAAGRA